MIGKNHRQQNSCATCAHCTMIYEYDQERELYCHIDKSERPSSGSVMMREHEPTREINRDKRLALSEKIRTEWRKWTEIRSVKESDVCDEWLKYEVK